MEDALYLFEGMLAGAFVLVIFMFLILAAWLVFYLIGMYKFFEKAGQPGWKGLIPYYNNYVMAVDMGGLRWYWFAIAVGCSLLTAIPIIGVIISLIGIFANVNMYYNLSKKLNKSTGWIVLATLFGGIVIPLLGFMNNTTWNQAAPVDPDGLFTQIMNANKNTNYQNTQNGANQNMQAQNVAQTQQNVSNQTTDNQTQNTNNQ